MIPVQEIKLIKSMNGHGGKRNGSGRKKGSPTLRTREVADRLAAEEITPLQVMIEVMLKHRAAGRDDKAAAVARDAAPYIHSRLSSATVKADVAVESTQVVEFIVTTREEADRAIAALAGASGVPRQ